MKKSIYLIVGAVLLLCHLSSADSLPSHARRSSVLATVGGSCTRYSCAPHEGFRNCLRDESGGRYTSIPSYTHEELKVLLKVTRVHPSCYKSFCIANCMTPPGVEEKPVSKGVRYCSEGDGDYFSVKKRSDLCGKISKLKEKKRNSYIEKMDQFIETKIDNCNEGDKDEVKGLGGILRRMCFFCGPLLGAEGYRVIQACKARNGDFPKDVEQRIGQLSKRDIGQNRSSSGGALQFIRQAGASAVSGLQAQGADAFNQARGYAHEQGRAHFNQARGYAVDQGRDLHNLAQGHVNRVSDQATRARKGAFREVDSFKKRTSGFASSLTDDIAEKRTALTSKLERLQRDATKREREIRARPSEYRANALRNLQRDKIAAEKKLEKELERLNKLEESGSEGEGNDAEDFDTDLDEVDED